MQQAAPNGTISEFIRPIRDRNVDSVSKQQRHLRVADIENVAAG
jgi:hypothetical protein